jgi:hypothetical protein
VSVEVDPRTIPELPVILRMDKLGKVRVLDVVCEHSHRLVRCFRCRPFGGSLTRVAPAATAKQSRCRYCAHVDRRTTRNTRKRHPSKR